VETNGLGHEPTSPPPPETSSVTLHVGGLHCASEKTVVEKTLSRRPGVLEVEANPVAHTATVIFRPRVTTPRQRAHKAVKAPAGVLDVAAWSLRHLYIILA
jgi:copper chaperone CopZ